MGFWERPIQGFTTNLDQGSYRVSGFGVVEFRVVRWVEENLHHLGFQYGHKL